MIHVKEGQQLRGRGPEKYFLYEIVANKISSIDVDKVCIPYSNINKIYIR